MFDYNDFFGQWGLSRFLGVALDLVAYVNDLPLVLFQETLEKDHLVAVLSFPGHLPAQRGVDLVIHDGLMGTDFGKGHPQADLILDL